MTAVTCAARNLVGHYGFTEQDVEDIEQDLLVDLLERLPQYDPAKGKRSTFAKNCMKHCISNMIRDRSRKCRDAQRCQELASLQAADGTNDRLGDTCSIHDLTCPRGEVEQEHADLRMDVADVVARLSPRQREICALLPEHSLYETSKRLKISKRQAYSDLEVIRAAFAKVGLNRGFAMCGKSEDQTV